jgi:hypothetical protein
VLSRRFFEKRSKEKDPVSTESSVFWCGRQELNLYALRHGILRLAGQTARFAFFCPICEYFTRLWPYFLFVRMKEM